MNLSFEFMVAVATIIGTLIEIFRQRNQHLTDLKAQGEAHEQAMERAIADNTQKNVQMINDHANKWSDQFNRQQRVNEELSLSNQRHLELYAQADTESKIYKGQVDVLTKQLESATNKLIEASEKLGRYEALKEQMSNMDRALREVQKSLSESAEANRNLLLEKLRLEAELRQRDQEIQLLKIQTERIPALERQIAELQKRLDDFENHPPLEEGKPNETVTFPFTADFDFDDGLPDLAGAGGIRQPGDRDADGKRLDDLASGDGDFLDSGVPVLADYRYF